MMIISTFLYFCKNYYDFITQPEHTLMEVVMLLFSTEGLKTGKLEGISRGGKGTVDQFNSFYHCHSA